MACCGLDAYHCGWWGIAVCCTAFSLVIQNRLPSYSIKWWSSAGPGCVVMCGLGFSTGSIASLPFYLGFGCSVVAVVSRLGGSMCRLAGLGSANSRSARVLNLSLDLGFVTFALGVQGSSLPRLCLVGAWVYARGFLSRCVWSWYICVSMI